MPCTLPKLTILTLGPLFVLLAQGALAATEDLGNGFLHHGVATPVSNHRGTVATVDGEGRNVVLVWLFDHRGGYALLMIDAETGDSEQIPMPFTTGDCPFSSVLDSEYTRVIDGTFAKVLSWYDNEWGYSKRVIDLALYMASKM